MINILKKGIQIIFAILMIYMLYVNVVFARFNIGVITFWILALVIGAILAIMLYKKNILTKKQMGIGVILLFILGIALRIFLILRIEMELVSDFSFFYNIALRNIKWRGA